MDKLAIILSGAMGLGNCMVKVFAKFGAKMHSHIFGFRDDAADKLCKVGYEAVAYKYLMAVVCLNCLQPVVSQLIKPIGIVS